MVETSDTQVHVFVSYSHRDRRWLDRLKVHLAPLAHKYDLDLWDDTRLTPGSRWRQTIRDAVAQANAAVLIISADFLASDFIRTNELPPLLQAAEEEGALILPIIASPSLYLRNPELSQFQAVNSPAAPLVSAFEGEQEETFVRVAEALLEKAGGLRSKAAEAAKRSTLGAREDFLESETWTRLVKIGDWIFDKERGRLIGSGMHAYLLSRDEYGDAPFTIQATLEFTNFLKPGPKRLGMNAGIIFGWVSEAGKNRYHNILLTGDEMLVERVGFKGGIVAEHISDPVPFPIQTGSTYSFEVRVTPDQIQIIAGGVEIKFPRPTGVVGRVGLRPWRSQLDCAKFVVTTTK